MRRKTDKSKPCCTENQPVGGWHVLNKQRATINKRKEGVYRCLNGIRLMVGEGVEKRKEKQSARSESTTWTNGKHGQGCWGRKDAFLESLGLWRENDCRLEQRFIISRSLLLLVRKRARAVGISAASFYCRWRPLPVSQGCVLFA